MLLVNKRNRAVEIPLPDADKASALTVDVADRRRAGAQREAGGRQDHAGAVCGNGGELVSAAGQAVEALCVYAAVECQARPKLMRRRTARFGRRCWSC